MPQSLMAQGADYIRRPPEVVTPTPFGIPKTRRPSARIFLPIDPATLDTLLNPEYSTACTRLRFNQIAKGRYFVLLEIPGGKPRRFGFARSDGINLFDPDSIRGGEQIYLFERDGSSECKVYVLRGGAA